jgi:hypothetical protein
MYRFAIIIKVIRNKEIPVLEKHKIINILFEAGIESKLNDKTKQIICTFAIQNGLPDILKLFIMYNINPSEKLKERIKHERYFCPHGTKESFLALFENPPIPLSFYLTNFVPDLSAAKPATASDLPTVIDVLAQDLLPLMEAVGIKLQTQEDQKPKEIHSPSL